MLSRYEQAKNLTITLLKQWLVEYKFKHWTTHRNDPKKKGKPVTKNERTKRAEEIAKLLSDNKVWHSHGRMIGVNTLRKFVRLEIEDYTQNEPLRSVITAYNSLLTDYIIKNDFTFVLHSRLSLLSRG